jgi:DNA-binding response OmpR family regulator
MANEKILVVEDDKDIVKLLKYSLEKEGFRVVASNDGETGLYAFGKERPDLIVLDLMLPKLDGFGFCRAVRAESATPIIMLTAKKGEVDRVLGLELGADDYVTKPFSVREVVARIRAILRRAAPAASGMKGFRAGDLEVDLERREVRVRKKAVALSFKEFEFLKCLLEAEGKVLSRDQILELVWGYDRSMDIDTRTVDQHIARLRERLGPESERVMTIKNVGYRLKAD